MLPAQYAFLTKIETPPRLIEEALKLYGVIETPGPGNTAQIMGWAKEVGVEKTYSADSIAWCGLFAAVVAKRAGWDVVQGPLWALNWAQFGVQSKIPGLGDVLVFKRDGGGHVGFYVGEDATAYHVLGGNSSDQVKIIRVPKQKLYACRRPKWRVAQPASVKPYLLGAVGSLGESMA